MKRLLLAATATAVLSGPAWAAGVCDTPPYDSNPATTEFVQKTSPITEHAIQIACKAKHRDEYVDDPEMPQIMYGMKTAFGTDLDAKLNRDPAVIAMDWTNALAQALKTEEAKRAEARAEGVADAARKAEAKYQAQLRAEAEANAHDVVEQEAKAKMEAQRPKIEADAREKAELERPRYEDAARAKIEAETKAKVDAEMRDKVEAETRANTDEDARAQIEAATREKDDAQIRADKAARERAAAELVARERDAHRVAINPSAPISPTLDTPSDFAAAYANVTALAQQNGIGPRHFCDKGYCANEIVQRTGIATFFAYVISPEGAAQFSSLCWQSGGPTRTCYTSLGRAWLDQPDGRGGWRTISQIRAQFPY